MSGLLKSNIKPLKTTQEINTKIKTLIEEILDATQACTKEITITAADIIVLPAELQMIKNKRKAKKGAKNAPSR